MAWRDWLGRQGRRDAVELVLLPGLAALLPWRWAFRVLRWLAFHWDWPYRTAVNEAWRQVVQRGLAAPEQERVWKAERRLVTLADHADMYLSLTRGLRFARQNLHIDGQWPAPGQAVLLVSFHWGAGMWGLYHGRDHGLRAVPLIESLKPEHFHGRPLLLRYARARVAQVNKALQREAVDISGSLRPVLQAWRQDWPVLAMADVPADRAMTSIAVRFAGRQALVPKALLKAVVAQRLPVVYYITGIDLLEGRRFLRIRQLGVFDDVQMLADTLFLLLDGLIAEKSAAWHFWDQAPRFFDGHSRQ